jgi:oxygen-independent coproporphyrinogen-3 oxidase
VVELRLIGGVNLSEFEAKNGALEKETLATIERLEKESFLERIKDCLRLTKRGILFYDTLASDLI